MQASWFRRVAEHAVELGRADGATAWVREVIVFCVYDHIYKAGALFLVVAGFVGD